jgi:hypothetical protein
MAGHNNRKVLTVGDKPEWFLKGDFLYICMCIQHVCICIYVCVNGRT